MNKLAYALVGFALGWAAGRITMLWFPIDEYHRIRMDTREKWAELEELRNDD